jgi:hypothetical protein
MGRSHDFAKVHFLRIADLGADRSKRQLSALGVDRHERRWPQLVDATL